MIGDSLGAFFLEISDIFHNITLPPWLSRLLPMKAIPFSTLLVETQLRFGRRIKLPSNSRDFTLRPIQATILMGFKWAVYIAHTFVSSCLDQSFQLLKVSRQALPKMALAKLRAERRSLPGQSERTTDFTLNRRRGNGHQQLDP